MTSPHKIQPSYAQAFDLLATLVAVVRTDGVVMFANAALEEARAEVEARSAKTEALQRAFQASGKTATEFADMYGLDAAAMRRLQLSASTATA